MTALQVYEAVLIELNKVKAPTVLLEDFNYFFNKSIIKYANKIYNLYEVNQQKTDDLHVLKSTAVLSPSIQPEFTTGTLRLSQAELLKGIYETYLPDDYLHLLNCIVEYKVLNKINCLNVGEFIHYGALRLTSDMYPQIINNYYFKPSYKKPYYSIQNITTSNSNPTTDNINTVPGITQVVSGKTENINDSPNNRYGNASKVRLEIRCGKINTALQVNKIYVDYIRTPKLIKLTEDQINYPSADISQLIEFQDYVIHEIINDLVAMLLENGSNPRLQSHIPINQTIPSK